MKEYLPIKYDILFYEESKASDALHVIQTTSTPYPISIGDKFEPWGDNGLPHNKMYKVIDVIREVFQVQNSHVLDCLSIVLTQIDRNEQSDLP